MVCVILHSLTQLCYRNFTKKPHEPLTHNALHLLLIFFIQDGVDLKGMKVMIKDLDDVLFRDVGGKIAADGRWDSVMDWLLTCNNHAYISILVQIFTTICLGNKTLLHQTLLTCVYRWPLLIDSTPQSSTFLRYRDTNFINALNPKHMEPDVIRLALLGGLRFVREVIHYIE